MRGEREVRDDPETSGPSTWLNGEPSTEMEAGGSERGRSLFGKFNEFTEDSQLIGDTI